MRRESRNCSRADVKDDRLRFGLFSAEQEWSGGTKRSEWRREVRSGTARSRKPDGSARRVSIPPGPSGTSGRGVKRVGHGLEGGQGRPVVEKWNAATVGPGGIDVGKSSVQTTSPSEADKAFALPEPPCGWGVAACTPQRVVLLMKLRRGNSILPPEYGAGQLSGILILS